MGIGALVSFTNLAIANNTVSIVITGNIAREINDEYHLSSRKTATVMDIFCCIVQGILPYGAQVLLLLNYAGGKLHFTDLIMNTWYVVFLFLFTMIAINNRHWDRLTNKFFKV